MKITHYIYIGLAVLALNSCNFLDEYSQDQAYVNTWEDLNELLIGGCYVPVNATREWQDQSNYGQFVHLLADELDERNVSTSGFPLYDAKYYTFGNYTWQARAGLQETYAGDYYTENTTWTAFYKCINVANNILKSSENLILDTHKEIAGYHKVRGEAYFTRAFLYFWLTNAYGQPYNPSTASTELGVPLKTSEEVLDTKYSRNTVQECYDLIVSDLLAAESELTQYGEKQASIYRADSTAAQLLLSRVYLYMQNWEKAEEYARKVIASHPELQNLNSNKASFMQKTNPENIFSMGGNDLPCLVFDAVHAYKVSKNLYQSYSENDLRKKSWYYSYSGFYGMTKLPENETYAGKFTQKDKDYCYYCYYTYLGSKLPISSLFWLRSSEAYFNLAEALAYQGKTDEAYKVLNTQRAARYLPGSQELAMTYTNEELVNLIRDERRKEFSLEGQRWFDLRRYRVCEKYPSKISLTHNYTYFTERGQDNMTETHVFTLTEDDPSWTCPIPQEVIEFNTGMPNNGNVYRNYEVIDPVKE